MNYYIIIIIILLILCLCYNKTENMSNDLTNNLTNHYNSFFNGISSYIIHDKIYKTNELIEITNLPQITKLIDVDYGYNENTINNNNISIYQNIMDPLSHTIELDGNNYNLISIAFKKTQFSWKQQEIGLAIHLNHTNYLSIATMTIIIPLDLTKSVENFKNIFYNKKLSTVLEDDTYLNNIADDEKEIIRKDYFNLNNNYANIGNSFPDINENKSSVKEINNFNLNIQYKNKIDIDNIISINNIPSYQCCTDSIGPLSKIIFYNIESIINNNNNIFYSLEEENNNIILITEPTPFSEEIGLYIRSNIIKDTSINYIKKLLQE